MTSQVSIAEIPPPLYEEFLPEDGGGDASVNAEPGQSFRPSIVL